MRVHPKVLAGVVALVGIGVAVPSSAASLTGAVPSEDLAIKGHVAGGERTLESSHLVVFVFKETNNGPTAGSSSADMDIKYLVGGTIVDQLCIQPDRKGFDPDSPGCEPGPLKVHQSAKMTVVVQPDPASTVSIKVCTYYEGDLPDPRSFNNCRTRSVRAY